MASLIAGHGHGANGEKGVKGLAPDSKILPIDIMSNLDTERTVGFKISEGLRYAVDNGAKVVNLSIAHYGVSERDEREIAYALNKGVVVVIGSGNSGRQSGKGKLAGLAKHPGLITVGAVDQGLKRWEGSSYGSGLTLMAPGTNMRTAGVDNKYGLTEGTSNATAYVSAAAALILEKYPNLTPGQVANRLVKTAVLPEHVKDRKTPNKEYGYGIIRPYSALTEDIPPGSKDGPLEVPPPPEGEKKPVVPTADGPADKDDSDSNFVAFAIGGGVAGFVLILVGVLVAVNRSKRRTAGAAPQYRGGPYGPLPPPGGNPSSPHQTFQ